MAGRSFLCGKKSESGEKRMAFDSSILSNSCERGDELSVKIHFAKMVSSQIYGNVCHTSSLISEQHYLSV